MKDIVKSVDFLIGDQILTVICEYVIIETNKYKLCELLIRFQILTSIMYMLYTLIRSIADY